MRRFIVTVILLLAGFAVTAEELTVGMILSAKRAGADANGLIKMINDPAYTVVKVSPAEVESLRAAGVAQEVLATLQARMPVPTPAPAQPDDPRLVDIVRLVRSGLSEDIIVEQIHTSKQVHDLSVNDLLYLKESSVPDAVIKALLATKGKPVAPVAAPVPAPAVVAAVPLPAAVAPAAAPVEDVVLENMLLVQTTYLKKNRPGRVSLKGGEVSWVDGVDAKESFSFKLAGVEKIWSTCHARGSDQICYQLNIQIAQGTCYRSQPLDRTTGSSESLHKLEQQIKARAPNAPFGPPELD
jgi:hypothetical protein